MRSILAATDLDPRSDHVLVAASAVARRVGAVLHVVHALDLVGRTLRETMGSLHDGCVSRAECALEAQVRRAVPGDAGSVRRSVDARAPLRAIAALAAEVGADLVAVGASATGPAGAACRLVREIGRPVLAVRPGRPWEPRAVLVLAAGEPGSVAEREESSGHLLVVPGGPPPRPEIPFLRDGPLPAMVR